LLQLLSSIEKELVEQDEDEKGRERTPSKKKRIKRKK